MQQRERDDGLLDLRPQDSDGLNQLQIDAIVKERGLDRDEVERELRYLRLISARRVKLPSDAYFADSRRRLYERVQVRKVTLWSRITAAIIPEAVRPLPASLVTAAIAVAITLSVLYYPHGNIKQPPVTAEGFGPYVSISDIYSQHVEPAEQGQLTEQEMKEYREILLMSTAILGSPSSLSRSRSLARSGK